jgi:hypothetical protein
VQTGGLRRFACSCPYDWGTCKHATALGLTLLDWFDDFCESGNDASDIAEYKNMFSEWMEQSTLNVIKQWEEPSGQSASRTTAVIRDAEIVPKNSTDKRRHTDSPVGSDPFDDLKRRLQSIGIDVETIPEAVIQTLGKNVKSGVLQVGAQFPKHVEMDRNTEYRERFLKRYVLVFRAEYSLRLELRERSKPNQDYWSVQPGVILRSGKSYLTPSQKEVLALIQKLRATYYEAIPDEDWGMIFDLVRESRMDVYFDSISASNKLSFEDVEKKIRIQLSLRSGDEFADNVGLSYRTDIVVTIEDIFSKKNSVFVVGINEMIAIVDGRIRIIPISRMVAMVMRRALEYVRLSLYNAQFDRSGQASSDVKYEVALIDEELIHINELMMEL